MDVRPVNDRVEELELELYRTGVDIKPGLMELLNWLRAEGIPAVTVTSSNRYIVEQLLENSGILPYMTELTCGDEITVGSQIHRSISKLQQNWVLIQSMALLLRIQPMVFYRLQRRVVAVFGVPDLVDLEARAGMKLSKR